MMKYYVIAVVFLIHCGGDCLTFLHFEQDVRLVCQKYPKLRVLVWNIVELHFVVSQSLLYFSDQHPYVPLPALRTEPRLVYWMQRLVFRLWPRLQLRFRLRLRLWLHPRPWPMPWLWLLPLLGSDSVSSYRLWIKLQALDQVIGSGSSYRLWIKLQPRFQLQLQRSIVHIGAAPNIIYWPLQTSMAYTFWYIFW